LQRAARVKARRSADESYDLFKLDGAKLWCDLVHAAVVEQQDSRDHILGHAFSGRALPLDEGRDRNDSSRRRNIIRQQQGRISKPG
jgi:hypothetical protein